MFTLSLWFFAVIQVDITQTARFSVILVPIWCSGCCVWCWFIHRLCFTRHRWHGCWQYCWCPRGLFLLSPMHSKNRKLDKEEQKHFGRKARLTAALELAVLGILWYAGQIPYAYAVYTGICITALFMLVGKAQLWIQSHTEKHTENG